MNNCNQRSPVFCFKKGSFRGRTICAKKKAVDILTTPSGNNREIREQHAAGTPRAEDRKAKETGLRAPRRRVLCLVWDVHHARSAIFRSTSLSHNLAITARGDSSRHRFLFLSFFKLRVAFLSIGRFQRIAREKKLKWKREGEGATFGVTNLIRG